KAQLEPARRDAVDGAPELLRNFQVRRGSKQTLFGYGPWPAFGIAVWNSELVAAKSNALDAPAQQPRDLVVRAGSEHCLIGRLPGLVPWVERRDAFLFSTRGDRFVTPFQAAGQFLIAHGPQQRFLL